MAFFMQKKEPDQRYSLKKAQVFMLRKVFVQYVILLVDIFTVLNKPAELALPKFLVHFSFNTLFQQLFNATASTT